MDSTYRILFLIVALFFDCSCHDKKSITAIKPGSEKPNIVVIMTDDQGWGDLGSNGNTNVNTPNIDSLAINGVSFDHFFVQPVCSPTRAEFLTGRHFTRLGVYDTSAGGERLNLGETTVAEIFKNAGYHTAVYGKWHNGTQPPYHPNSRGFDDFYGFASGHWGNYFDPMLEHNGKITKGKGYLPNDLTDHAISFLAKHKPAPFFLYLAYNTPHSPMQVPDAYWDRFKDKELNQKYHGTEVEEPDFTKAALAMVENIDDNIGRLMAGLRKNHLEENTIIIFMSDNGPNSWRYNGGMRGKKGSTDEGGVRVPFYIQWKNKLQAGKKITQIASAPDILPTLASLAKIAAKTNTAIDGKDLSPLLLRDNAVWPERYVYAHWNDKTSARSQRFRLDDNDQLYDMYNDPGQSTDVSKRFAAIADSLKKAKIKWLASTHSKEKADRPFTLGGSEQIFTQLPARDGVPHGSVERSNQYPNDSYFTSWKSENDSITWDVEVLQSGNFEVGLYYTLSEENKPVSVELVHGKSKLVSEINQTHDPPLQIPNTDRVKRMESYVKDFKPMVLGTMALEKGRNLLTLRATHISGNAAMDVRLLLFKRID